MFKCQEFLAIDRKLSAADIAYLTNLAWPVQVTPNGFRREHCCDRDERDAADLLARFFDAHMFAEWGSKRRLMLRLTLDRAGRRALVPYLLEGMVQVTCLEDCVVLDFQAGVDDPDLLAVPRYSLSAMAPLRAELAKGDRRSLYLMWLRAVQSGVVPPEVSEPPVPPNLARLTPAQTALVRFFVLDRDLLEAARTVEGSQPSDGGARSAADLSTRARRCRLARLDAEDAAMRAQADALSSIGDVSGAIRLLGRLLERGMRRNSQSASGVNPPGAPSWEQPSGARRR